MKNSKELMPDQIEDAIRVIVVEDEDFALQSLCRIIQKDCAAYEVVAACSNGEEALRAIQNQLPDLIISDIRMPGISGVELAAWVHEHYPSVEFVIVSGYQDFAYAQSAIKSGVSDYLLKPLAPVKIRETLADLEQNIRETKNKKINRILKKIARGESVSEEEIKNWIRYPYYYGAIIRRGPLPGRFAEHCHEVYGDVNEHYLLFGRDELEEMVLIPAVYIDNAETFRRLIEHRTKKGIGNKNSDFVTAIYSEELIARKQLSVGIPGLFSALDGAIIIGKSQILSLQKHEKGKLADRRKAEDMDSLKTLELLLNSGKREEAEQFVRRLFKRWEQEGVPQLMVELLARALCFQNVLIKKNHRIRMDEEVLFEEAFQNAGTMSGLAESMLEIMFPDPAEKENPGAAVVFDRIVSFIQSHISEPVSLQEICHQFGLSQTYVSKIFRSNSGKSFNQYVTEQKMRKARQIFEEHPQFFVKDVAHMVGYEDQFYFSRIFRTYTGKSPSVYLKEKEKKGL